MTAPLTPTKAELLKQHDELISQAAMYAFLGQRRAAREILGIAERIKERLEKMGAENEQ